MKTITLISIVLLTLSLAYADEKSESLLGKPVSALIGSIDKYKIEVQQAKGIPVVTEADARYALEHSELVDPTLPEVRNNDFPDIAELYLTKRDTPNEHVRLKLCSLGLYTEVRITYVFRYKMPEGWAKTK